MEQYVILLMVCYELWAAVMSDRSTGVVCCPWLAERRGNIITKEATLQKRKAAREGKGFGERI